MIFYFGWHTINICIFKCQVECLSIALQFKSTAFSCLRPCHPMCRGHMPHSHPASLEAGPCCAVAVGVLCVWGGEHPWALPRGCRSGICIRRLLAELLGILKPNLTPPHPGRAPGFYGYTALDPIQNLSRDYGVTLRTSDS